MLESFSSADAFLPNSFHASPPHSHLRCELTNFAGVRATKNGEFLPSHWISVAAF